MSEETVQNKKPRQRRKKEESKTTQISDNQIIPEQEQKKLTQKSKKQASPQKKQESPPKKKQTPPKKKGKKTPEKKGKQPLIKEDVESLLEYFKQQNRPFTVNYLKDTLFLKLSTLQKNIDTLISKGDVIMKEVGSTKVFLINQELMPQVNEQDIDLLASTLEQKTEEYKQLVAQNNKLNEQLKNLQKIMTLTELEEQKNDLFSKISAIQNKLLQYQDKNFRMASEEEVKKVEKDHETMQNICKKRKNIYNEAMGSLMSESDLTVPQFEKIVGIFRD